MKKGKEIMPSYTPNDRIKLEKLPTVPGLIK